MQLLRRKSGGGSATHLGAARVRLRHVRLQRHDRHHGSVACGVVATGRSEASASLFRYRQIESANRVVLDVERLRYRGLAPSVFAGVDLCLLRGDIGEATAIVPVLGVGLTNGAF